MRIVRYILIVLLLLFALSFALLNAGNVELNYYLGTVKIALSLLLVLTFAIGCVVGFLISMSWYLKARWEARKINKKLAETEKELASLRVMPLKDLSS